MIDLFSDMHKDAFGFRPSAEAVESFGTLPVERQNVITDDFQEKINENEEREKRFAQDAVVELREQIESIIKLGDVADVTFSRTSALRWMTAEEHFGHSQDVEHWVWEQGVLFTDFGKALVKELCTAWKV